MSYPIEINESFVYFMQVMSKVIESKAAEFQSRRKKESSPNGSSSRSPPQHANANAEDLEDNEDNE